MAAVNRARSTTSAVGWRARFAWRTAAMLATVLAVAACQQAQQEDSEPTSAPGLEVRHDTEPLAETFPALGDPVSASWIMWDNSTVAEESSVEVMWIDAVVEVTPETMDALVADNVTEDRDQHPAVQRVLEPDLPPGPFLTGVDLNIVFGGAGQSTRVFLDEQHDTVVLQSYAMNPR